MSKDNSTSFIDMVACIIGIKYVLPWIIIIIAVLFGIAFFHKGMIAMSVDKDKTILYTNFSKTVSKIIEDSVNSKEFDIKIEDTSVNSTHTIEVHYSTINDNYTAEQYDRLIKEEITKVYNQIKDKEIVNDTLFGQDSLINNVDIYFNIRFDDSYKMWINGIELKYSAENRWDKSYNELMNTTLISQETINKIRSQK